MIKELYNTKEECCGCYACYSVCPMGAIELNRDGEGFEYPEINQKKCIGCGKCEIVCPIKNQRKNIEPIHIFAVKNRDESVRKISSSGGVFTLLAKYIESQNGVIYGAAFDEKYKVCHKRAERTKEWKEFCVSKYVQSDIKETYSQVCDDLVDDRMVLFSGTPCQIDGLKRYIEKMGKDCSKLFTCDIVCHGTPSPGVWEDYLVYLQEKKKQKIGYISFRDKEQLGWHNSKLTIRDKDNNLILSETQSDNFFFQRFVCHEILRPSCFKCKYANYNRVGDITLGDFWGIENKFPNFDDNKGVSLVMVNSEKGERLWENVNGFAEYFEVTKEQSVQPNLQKPSEEIGNRDVFWSWYRKYGLERTGQMMGQLPMSKSERVLVFLYRCKERIMRIIRIE